MSATHLGGLLVDAQQHPFATTDRPRPPTTKMLFSSFGLLAAASSLLSLTSAHNIQMKAHQRECFHEQLHKDDKMTVTFQVGDREFGGSGNLEIDFWVCSKATRIRHGC